MRDSVSTLALVLSLASQGLSSRQIASRVGMSHTSVQKWLRSNGVVSTKSSKFSCLADILAFTDKTSSGCLVWRGTLDKKGYGRVYFDGKSRRPHRVSYFLYHNLDLNTNTVVRHSCDNPSCCNPLHLQAGTHTDNVRDRDERDRTCRGTDKPNVKLTDEEVSLIRERYSLGCYSIRELAFSFCVSYSSVRDIIHRKTWKHIL